MDNFICNAEANRLRKINMDFLCLKQMEELIIKKYESNSEEFKIFSEFMPELLTVVN